MKKLTTLFILSALVVFFWSSYQNRNIITGVENLNSHISEIAQCE